MAKSVFIANISHELRTPLNALLGMAQLLERAELPKQQADHVKVMLEAGRGLQTLIDDVIALTRDDDGQLEDEDCDPMQAARAVVRLLQPRAWEKRLRLTLSGASGLPRVAADPRKVRQVLLKLADNALKFTERGLVEIRLEMQPKTARSVRFCVSDTGQGVAPEHGQPSVQSLLAGRYLLCPQGTGRGAGPGRGQAHGRTGRRPHRLFQQARRRGAVLLHPAGFRLGAGGDACASRKAASRAPSGLSLLLFLPFREVADGLIAPAGAVRQPPASVADSLAEAVERAGKDRFDAIIAGAGDADMLAAAPGVKAPLVAVLLRGDRAPCRHRYVLRWPVEPDQLYRALDAAASRRRRRTEDRSGRTVGRHRRRSFLRPGAVGRA